MRVEKVEEGRGETRGLVRVAVAGWTAKPLTGAGAAKLKPRMARSFMVFCLLLVDVVVVVVVAVGSIVESMLLLSDCGVDVCVVCGLERRGIAWLLILCFCVAGLMCLWPFANFVTTCSKE